MDTMDNLPYFFSTFFNSITTSLTLTIVSYLFTKTNVNAYEVVYFQCGAIVLGVFIYTLIKGIYILDVEKEYRVLILTKSAISFVGNVFFYLALEDLKLISWVIIT